MNINEVVYRLLEEKKLFIDVLPEELKDKFNDSSYITGGSIYSLLHTRSFKDVDFFLDSEEVLNEVLTYFNSLTLHIKSSVNGAVKKGTYKGLPIIITNNAISIGYWQIITREYGSPSDVLDQFDFQHNMFYIKDGKLNALAPVSVLKGSELIYNERRARNIAGTIVRIPKFVSRGMTITNSEMNRILYYLHEVGFSDEEIDCITNYDAGWNFGS